MSPRSFKIDSEGDNKKEWLEAAPFYVVQCMKNPPDLPMADSVDSLRSSGGYIASEWFASNL